KREDFKRRKEKGRKRNQETAEGICRCSHEGLGQLQGGDRSPDREPSCRTPKNARARRGSEQAYRPAQQTQCSRGQSPCRTRRPAARRAPRRRWGSELSAIANDGFLCYE